MIKVIDNVSSILRDDLAETVHRGDKVSIAAAYFSMYAYRELKKQLENVDEFRFIFNFISRYASRNKRPVQIMLFTLQCEPGENKDRVMRSMDALESAAAVCLRMVDVGNRFSDKQYGYVHACSTYPLTDMTIEVPII